MRKPVLSLLAFTLTLTLVPTLWAQGRQRGQRPPQHPTAQQTGPKGRHQGEPNRTRDRDRVRIHMTEQQRSHMGDCTRAANSVHEQARKMHSTAKANRFEAGNLRQQHTELQARIRSMNEIHSRFMGSLNAEQQEALQQRVREMEQAQRRMQKSVEALDRELDGEQMRRKRLQSHARNLERAVKEWQKQYREMNEQMVGP